MYKINKEIKFPEFKNSSLLMVNVGLYQLILNFDNDTSITIEHKLEIFENSKRAIWTPNAPQFNLNLHAILQKKIVSFEILEALHLKFTLEDNSYFIIYGDNEKYECYQVINGSNYIVV